MDNSLKFNEMTLPNIEAFYSILNECQISKEDYAHAKRVWKEFNVKNMGDYTELYVKTDLLPF